MLITYIFGMLAGNKRRSHSFTIFIALASAMLALAACGQSCDPLPANAVSWWSGEGTAYDNLSVNNGTNVGGVTFTPGIAGSAFRFNGSGQFIHVPDSPSLRLTTAMTLEAWVYPTAYNSSSDSSIICKFGAYVAGQCAWSFFVNNDGRGGILISHDGVNGVNSLYTVHICPLNTWTHMAATYDGATLKIYFNGALENSDSEPGSIFAGTYDLGIGANVGGVSDANAAALFIGMIDEPTIYNRALSSNEISAIYSAGAAGKCPLPASIVLEPASQTVYPNDEVTLSVGAVGGPFNTFQWYLNGTNIAGATSSALFFNFIQPDQAGDYTVTVSNSATPVPVTSSDAVLTVLTPPPCDSPPSGIVSWWAAEGNALDNIGTNNGIPLNSPTYGAGKVHRAFNLNGNQWIRIPDAPNLRFTNGMTLEAWVNPTAYNPGADSGIIVKYGGFTAGQSAYSFYLHNNGYPTVQLSADGSSPAANVSATDVCPTNTWTHVAATYDGSTLSIYFNGNLEGSTALSGNIFPGTYDLGIGAALGGGGTTQGAAIFNGLIDEPAVYNRALSASEIQAIYNADVAGKCPPPITITSQPTNESAPYGGSTNFTVGAIGGQPITYQWYFDGTNLAGATNSFLTFSNLQLNQSGTYYAAITNPAGSLNSSNGTLTVIPPPPCDPAPSNIVSWWAAESNAVDNTGGNNGSLVGSPTFTAGKVGLAFNFNGSSQFVRVPNAPNLHFSNAMTAEAWVYPTAYNPQYSAVLSKFDGAGGINQASWVIYITPSGLGRFDISTNGVSPATTVLTTNVCPTNVWTHLAATYDGTNVWLYFNGLLQASATASGNLFPGADDVGIGAKLGGVPNNSAQALFNGLIDEPALYNRALSSNEIAAIYNAGASGKCALSLPPTVSLVPSFEKITPGASATFDAAISGSPTLTYQWLFNGANIPGATNRPLIVSNVTTANAGNYAFVVSNSVNSAVSGNAQLEVVLVTVLANSVPLTNSQYTFTNSVTIKLVNFFSGGDIFYTLDGSPPTPDSTLYNGQFQLTNSAVIRTLGYSPDFQQYAVSDPIAITFPAVYTLSATSPGGGAITVNPSATNFLANTLVTLAANPSNGWRFLQWTGDIGGSNSTNTVFMDRSKSVQAIFGTSVSNISGGSGSIIFNPPGGIYPFGTVLQAAAIPQTGNFFVLWGDNASGDVNPLSFPVTNANQTISALFYNLSAGEVALSVVPVGPGTVAVNPQANTYTAGAQVTLTATPIAGKNFLGWSGGASGTNNPLNVILNQSETIYANFTTNTTLVIYPVTAPGTGGGVAIDLNGQTGYHYRLDSSSDLVNWTNLYNLTNYVGLLHYVDSTTTNSPFRYYRAELVVP